MYTFNWAITAFRSESYIGSATALPDSIVFGQKIDFAKKKKKDDTAKGISRGVE